MQGDDTADGSKTAVRSESDERHLAATIGEPQVLDSTVYLAPYDPAWLSIFSLQADRIRGALGNNILMLEHVGSTSVPGLSAKPVIDIVLEVVDSADEASYVPPLEKQGYALRAREPDWFEHRFLRSPDAIANLHVFSAGCEETGRMLAFRDWLRTHENDRKLYEQTKRELSARTWKYTQNYADAKSEIVEAILTRALVSVAKGGAG